MKAWGFLFYILIFHSSPPWSKGKMGPIDFKKENKGKKSVTSSTFIAPKPTRPNNFHRSPSKCRRHCAYTHAKSKSKPLWHSRGHLGLCGHKHTPPVFAQTSEGLCTGRTSLTDFGLCRTWNKTSAIAVEVSPKALTGLILSRTRYAMQCTCGK